MKKVLAILLALVMVFSFAACGEKEEAAENTAPKFIMGIDPEYPPFSYLGDDGEYTGFDVDVCRAACAKLGWELEIFGVNWDEKLVQLDAGECDCVWAGMTLLPSMAEAGYVLSAPYYDNTQVILVKEASGIKTSADLAGKDVAVQLGTSGEALLNDEEGLADLKNTFNQLITCDSFLKCFAELDGNSVDAVFVDAPVAKSYAEGKEGYLIIDEQLGAEQYGIAFRNADQALCDQIEAAVAELVADGTYAEIAAKYPDIVNNLLFLQ
ncbi:MAG: transporter substrate-binding domain-containing protein [Bacillota bacterium]|nr:transporter substrate-binding domain-containing protein [Bacillota bacterium]